MTSLLTTVFVLLALFRMLFQTAADTRRNSPTWTDSKSLRQRRKAKLPEVTCDEYASCAPDVDHANTCFCDRLCRIYGDCCPDYVSEEGGRQLTPLPLHLFTCGLLSLQHVYIITECPPTYRIQFVLDGCRLGSASGRHSSNETFYVVPVSGRTSGLVYLNVYCAMCHGEEDVSFWNVATRHCDEPRSSEPQSAGAENIDDLMRQRSFIGDCSFLYLPSSDVPPPRRCVENIDSCPDDADPELAARCTQPSNVAYVYMDILAYRNRDCAACHGIEDYSLACNSSSVVTGRKVDVNDFESFSIILDLNIGKGSTVRSRSGGSRTQSLGSCPDKHVYDPFVGSCHAISCPPGHSFSQNGECLRHPMLVRSHDVSVSVDRPPTPMTASDPDCAWIQFSPSQYQVLINRSIYIQVHDATYDANSYRLDDNSTAYVCTPFQRNYTEWVHEALTVDTVGAYLSLICSVISLLALTFQFAVYMAFPVLRNTPGRCIISLVVSLFVGQLLFLLVKAGTPVTTGFCFGQAALMHFAFMAAFFWMNVMAVDVYRTFSASPGAAASSSSSVGARRRFVGYSLYAWMSAAVIVSVGLTLDLADIGGTYRPHYGHRICWFGSREGLLVLFGLPVGAILAANVILFALSVRQIRMASMASQMAVQKTDETQLLVSIISTLISWQLFSITFLRISPIFDS